MTRLLVTGAAGAVGSYVPDVFSDCELLLTDIAGDCQRLDVGDPEVVRDTVREARPDVVLHLAAATDVDRCEHEPDLAFRSNAIGTHNVALACREAGAELVYVSTAAVFPGTRDEPYTEFDAVSPANVYAHSKLAGERSVATILDRHFVVRAGWMFGGLERDTKFVGKIAELVLGGAERLRAVDDKIGSPTYARDLLEGIRRLLDARLYGVYHLVNSGAPVSRHEIAVAICDVLGRPELQVEPVSSEAFPLPAPRGRSEAVRNYRLELLGLGPMPPWRDALRRYVTRELLPSLERDGAGRDAA